MTTIRGSILLGAALILGSISSTQAADLYSGGYKGSIKDDVVVAGPASWYIRGDVGYGHYDAPVMVENGTFDLINTSIDKTWSLGGGVGRYFGGALRGDLTYDYRFETDVSATNGDANANFTGGRKFGLKSHVFLANMYYDFNREGRINPYLGAGLGFVRHKTLESTVVDSCGCVATLAGAETTDVAAALMAGFSWKMRDRLHLDAGYRFLYLGKTHTGDITYATGPTVVGDPTVEDIHVHEFRVGMRYDIR